MFRLNRKWLGNPCDFCMHNKSPFGYFGTALFGLYTCDKAYAPMPTSLPNNQKFTKTSKNSICCVWTKLNEKSEVQNMHCPGFELSIPRLEDAVYNKKQFSLTPSTLCILENDGSWKAAVDPLAISIMSTKAWLASKHLVHKPNVQFLKKHLIKMQERYVPSYRNLDYADRVSVACSAWIVTLTLMTMEFAISSETSKTISKSLYSIIMSYVDHCGWPISKDERERIAANAKRAIHDDGTSRMKTINFDI